MPEIVITAVNWVTIRKKSHDSGAGKLSFRLKISPPHALVGFPCGGWSSTLSCGTLFFYLVQKPIETPNRNVMRFASLLFGKRVMLPSELSWMSPLVKKLTIPF